MPKIKNVPNTAKLNCGCTSWLQHWRNCSGQSICFCPVMNCLNKDLTGKLVKEASGKDDCKYIIPMCIYHAASKEVLDVSDAYRQVSADQTESCAKVITRVRVPAV